MIKGLGAAGLVAITAIAVPSAVASPARVVNGASRACTDAAVGHSTIAVVKTIRVGSGPQGVAVDSADDVVYVTNADSDSMSIIDGTTATVAATVDGFSEPVGVAVNEADDIVYVANADDSSVVSISGSGRGTRTTVPIGGLGWDVAVDQDDDTVYATAALPQGDSGSLAVIDGTRQSLSSVVAFAGLSPLAVAVSDRSNRIYVTGQNTVGAAALDGVTLAIDDTIPLVGSYWDVAIHEEDDTAYFPNYQEQGSFAIVSGRTSQVMSNEPLAWPWGVAVSQAADLVYVARGPTNTVSVLDATTGAQAIPSLAVGRFPIAIAVDQSGPNVGTVYVANSDDISVSVLGSVRPSLTSSRSRPGSKLVVAVDAPQADYDLASRAVSAVCFVREGGATGTLGGSVTARAGDRWAVTVPSRLRGGTYRVVVTFDGGLQARAGRITLTR
ncbi:MAG: hypothetical protein B7C55_12200 [Actinomycetales bacterium mxb001]|nr:MAG: hypothetical protein B7C55_12200 [Actinomycetales bacterium mxb001]